MKLYYTGAGPVDLPDGLGRVEPGSLTPEMSDEMAQHFLETRPDFAKAKPKSKPVEKEK